MTHTILADLIRVWDNKDRGWPPQDVADLMGELRIIVERARIVSANTITATPNGVHDYLTELMRAIMAGEALTWQQRYAIIELIDSRLREEGASHDDTPHHRPRTSPAG